MSQNPPEIQVSSGGANKDLGLLVLVLALGAVWWVDSLLFPEEPEEENKPPEVTSSALSSLTMVPGAERDISSWFTDPDGRLTSSNYTEIGEWPRHVSIFFEDLSVSVFASSGTYELTIRVTDRDGASVSHRVTLRIVDASEEPEEPEEPEEENKPPEVTSSALSSLTMVPGTMRDISSWFTDPDGRLTSSNYTEIGEWPRHVSIFFENLWVTVFASSGTYELTIRVADRDGASVSHRVTLRIVDGRNESAVSDAMLDTADETIVAAAESESTLTLEEPRAASTANVDLGHEETGTGQQVEGSFAVTTQGHVLDTSALAPARGSILHGDAADDRLGHSVSGAGDINGDGIDDLIVGASGGDDGGDNAGEAYIIYGGPHLGGAATRAEESLTGVADELFFFG